MRKAHVYRILDQHSNSIQIPGPALGTAETMSAAALVGRIMHLAKFFNVREMASEAGAEHLVRLRVLGKIDGKNKEDSQRWSPIQYGAHTRIPEYVKPWDSP